jgi:hypothetical protein
MNTFQQSSDFSSLARELRRLMIRRVETYPKTANDKGEYGDYAVNSDETKLAIRLNTQWKSITLSSTI